MRTIEQLGADAEQARADFDRVAERLRTAARKLRKLERIRSDQKLEAAGRLVLKENAANQAKPFTFAQACDFAQHDPIYQAYKEACDAATMEKEHAEQDLESAKLAAELANNLVRASVGAGL